MKYEELGSVETINFLYRLQCAYSSSKSTKDVFNVQEMWNSPNVLHTNDPFFFGVLIPLSAICQLCHGDQV
jgi:hypothetical protein